MYGPKWPFLLIYMSHDMRQIFHRLTGGQRDTSGFGASHHVRTSRPHTRPDPEYEPDPRRGPLFYKSKYNSFFE